MMQIQLRHIYQSDKWIKAYITDIQVTKFLTRNAYIRQRDIDKFIEYASTCISYPNEFLAILYEDKPIGTAHILSENDYIKIGFGIMPYIRWKWLGTQLVKHIIQYVSQSSRHHISKIVAEVHVENKAAVHVLLNNNFTLLEMADMHSREKYILILKE